MDASPNWEGLRRWDPSLPSAKGGYICSMTSGDRVRLIRSDELAPAPYAYASVVPEGSRLIHLAGACPLDVDGQVPPEFGVAAQAARCLDNLEIALAAADATLADVVSTRVLVATSDRGDLSAAWRVVAERFGEHDVPSTLVGVAVLGYPGQLVEIEAIAATRD
jgi:enamine deaminase RidA (YjgF/YER057c/UK114 family)